MIVVQKKDYYGAFIVICSVIFIWFALVAYNQHQNSKKAETGLIGNKEELKKLSAELVGSMRQGASQLKIESLTKKINNISELVVIGKIISEESAMQDNSTLYNAVGFFTLKVESVERGNYPHEEIKFLFGMASNALPASLYPGYVKTKYHSGERVRVYLNYFREFRGYAAIAGYYGMQPLN